MRTFTKADKPEPKADPEKDLNGIIERKVQYLKKTGKMRQEKKTFSKAG